MTTNEAFLNALNNEQIKGKYPPSSVRTWRSRAIRGKLSLDFMIEFLRENGYKIKQPLQWHARGEDSSKPRQVTPGELPADVKNGDARLQLNKKLYAIRKQLNADLYNKWYEWSKAEYAQHFSYKSSPLSAVVFSQLTYGRYISKENLPFAIKILKEGKRLLHDYNEKMRLELENL